MTADELAAYHVEPEGFWLACQLRGDDGYDRIEVARRHRWRAVPSWGRDGWDLGSWPLVVVYWRDADGAYELAENVEGDVAVYRFPTRELREEATNLFAFTHWRSAGAEWLEGAEACVAMPAHLRGPYSRSRA